MQYLLTEDEYRSLEPKIIREEEHRAMAKLFPSLQELVKCHRLKDKSRGYCDDCLLSSERVICQLPRSFSK